ncbi:MAG TPA: DUF4038 domain-containing protein [Galbitalea sp.]|nr:DUF4038 domain-containing protein [Galbitalea sp.]
MQSVSRYDYLDFVVPAAPAALPASARHVHHLLPSGRELLVPCFESTDNSDVLTTRVRVSAVEPGVHRLTVGQGEPPFAEFTAGEVTDSAQATPLQKHGAPVRDVRSRHLTYADGVPFLWLGDTWWHGLGDRIDDDEFAHLAALRVKQGFTAVQIVAGLNVDVEPFSPMADSEEGWPWHEGFTGLNTAWWDAADVRIRALVDAGLVPIIFGSWGYYLDFMTDEQMLAHWREVIARWSALPVVWSIAGEVTLPFYFQPMREASSAERNNLRERWHAIAEQVRELDPYGRLLTAHPAPGARDYATSETFPGDGMDIFDIDILQTGHLSGRTLDWTQVVFDGAFGRHAKPVINVEVNYEGIAGGSDDVMQRFLWWSNMLEGASGFTYGAQGLWAFEDESWRGVTGSWGRVNWRDAVKRPGAVHIGSARRWLSQKDWSHLLPLGASVRSARNIVDAVRPFAAAFPDGTVVGYLPALSMFGDSRALQTLWIPVGTANADYRVTFLDPRTCDPVSTSDYTSDGWSQVMLGPGPITCAPSMEDWLLLIEPTTATGEKETAR